MNAVTQDVKVRKPPVLQPWQADLIQRVRIRRVVGTRPHIRIRHTANHQFEILQRWPDDFSPADYTKLRYGGIVWRGAVRYYEGDV